ncbi:GlxA family transcriptional regulator [Bradyrhizobium sp. WSM1253]|uniref:GlxA family transcriptional regulator n=1 Tax=Bradyrhizobium sp. WSM1253 TaxID=319003 RepID=UPI00025D1A6F|nr:GlxA family transcriptional regulator [Bradyrhizobium sp. WSM1253]EIG57865.1 transcriptional regulator containing an amidase domain and an AraC-type DNA-binding HTH domain [Bradyrhizobium sp. WSM1253]
MTHGDVPAPGRSRDGHGVPEQTIRVGIVVINGANTIDFMGPIDAFNEAGRSPATSVRYKVDLIGAAPGLIVGSSGVRIVPDKVIGSELDTFYDTILVAGSQELQPSGDNNQPLIDWLTRAAASARRICATCAGTFVLASAGLLDGRRVATHRNYTRQFAARFPQVHMEPDRLFAHDGLYYTAVGGMAGIDLCLYLIENDCGQATFLDVARMMVIFLRRPGNHPQVSEFLKAQSIRNSQISHVMDWALANLAADLSVDALAKRAAMSSRNFSRTFTDEMMTTPARFVEGIRVEAARILLETTLLSVQQISHRAGFGSPANMRRAFARAFQTPPTQYRHNIGSAMPGAQAAQLLKV